MSNRPKHGGRREPPGGRPRKDNVRIQAYIQKTTMALIEHAKQKDESLGEVLDRLVKSAHDSHFDSQADQTVGDEG